MSEIECTQLHRELFRRRHSTRQSRGLFALAKHLSKSLGVYIDSVLSWQYHIGFIYNKIIKFTSIFYKIRNMLSFDILKIIYFAFVHSHLVDGIEIYANSHMKYINKLVVLNNKILRILQNVSRDRPTHTAELHDKFSTLPIPALHQCQILQLVHKFTHHRDKLPATYSIFLLKLYLPFLQYTY